MGSQTEIREVQSVSGMDCRTAESMVTRFIDHSLSVNELEEFLDHIETCPSCYDELETYFIVHEAMRRRTGQSLTLRNFWSRRSGDPDVSFIRQEESVLLWGLSAWQPLWPCAYS